MSRVKKDACVSVENKTKLFCFTAIVSTSVVFLCILTIVRVLLGAAFTVIKDVQDTEILEVIEYLDADALSTILCLGKLT